MKSHEAQAAEEIEIGEWSTFLAEFTRRNRGAHARIEVFDRGVGRLVETDNRPLDGISADVKNRDRAVWITFGSTPADHLAHGVHNVTALRVRPPAGSRGAAVEMEAQDGTRTLLELTRPEAFSLPPTKTPADT